MSDPTTPPPIPLAPRQPMTPGDLLDVWGGPDEPDPEFDPDLAAGDPDFSTMAKGDTPGHAFHGNQYETVGSDAKPEPLTFRITGFKNHDGTPSWVQVQAIVPRYEDAKPIAESFPKSAKAGWSGTIGVHGYVSFRGIKFTANKANAGINETGIKRYHNLKKLITKAGHKFVYDSGFVLPDGTHVDYGNSYATIDEFERALGQ